MQKNEFYEIIKNIRKNSLNEKINMLLKEQIDIEKNKTSINEKLKRLLEHQEYLNRSCPGDNKIISSEKEYLHNLKSRLENTSDYEKQIKSLKDDLNINEKNKFESKRLNITAT